MLDSDGNNVISDQSSRLDTKENLIGPVKNEFEELQRKIMEKTQELEGLEEQFYGKVSSVSLELEGIGEKQEEELERHRHLYEMQQLQELDKRMSRVEAEKVRLLQME
jgi:predicted  nucleic acid-binding Zn-ribbon protein